MATAPDMISTRQRAKPFVERWYFTGMAIVMLAVSVAGFLPAIVHPAGRSAPLTLLAAAHGMVFFAWLLLFLAQSLLAATGRVQWHRRLGLSAVVLLVLMIPLGFLTTTAMVRRGFDLSGDQHIGFPPPRDWTYTPVRSSTSAACLSSPSWPWQQYVTGAGPRFTDG